MNGVADGDKRNHDFERLHYSGSPTGSAMPCCFTDRLTWRASATATVAAIIAVIVSLPIVAAQSSDLQAKCAAQAEAAFEELTREYVDVLESLSIPFEITSNDYQAHYNRKLGRCLFLVRKSATVMHNSSDMSYLLDASNRNMYALYVDAAGKMDSCTLIRSVRETRSCKGRSEFEAFVAGYMKN